MNIKKKHDMIDINNTMGIKALKGAYISSPLKDPTLTVEACVIEP